MAKKQERVPVTSQFGRGADAFFGPATEEEKQDTGIPVQQETVKPVERSSSLPVEQDASKTVNQGTGKAEFMKATFLREEEAESRRLESPERGCALSCCSRSGRKRA